MNGETHVHTAASTLTAGLRQALRLAIVSILLLGGVTITRVATAQLAPASNRDHHQLIRMNITSQGQLNAVLALGAEPWNCLIGLGEQDFSISPQALQQLNAAGLGRYRVLHDNVQMLIDADVARMRGGGVPPANDGGIAGAPGAWFLDYKTYPQVNAYMDTLVALRPDLASKLTVGTSIQGRTMYAMRITSTLGGPNKPAILYTGCQHAREWIAVMVPMYIADTLVRGYGSDPRITSLLDRAEIFIVPIVNPDGYEYTYALAGDRLWRKNRRDNGDGTFGVDLNRNWSVDWNGGNSTSTNGDSEVYVGTGPFSEPETAALRDFVIARPQLIASIDFHSYAQLVLESWAYTNAENADHDVIDAVGTAMNQGIASVNSAFYQNGWGGSLLYLASGVQPDWNYGVRGMLAYTIEVRDRGATGFLLPPDQIMPTCTENLQAALALAEHALGGAEFLFPRGVPATVETGSSANIRVDIRPTLQSVLQPATAKVFWRIGSSGAFTPSTLSIVAAAQYQATLPALACGQRVEFYFEIQNGAGVPLHSPATAPAAVYSANAGRTLLSYNFETAAGWTTAVSGATDGQWQRGVPVNDPNWPYDPRNDADGSGQCWLTRNTIGASDVDNGSVLLMSPVINVPALLSAGERASIAYAYFLHHVSPVGGDLLKVEISTNGLAGPFTQIALHTTNGGALWRRNTITAAQLSGLGITPNATTVLRFTATDGNPQSIIEAAVDDVRIFGDCSSATCPADIVPVGPPHNHVVNVDDLLAVITSWGPCAAPPCPADIAPPGGNGQVNVDDLLAVITGWGPCP